MQKQTLTIFLVLLMCMGVGCRSETETEPIPEVHRPEATRCISEDSCVTDGDCENKTVCVCHEGEGSGCLREGNCRIDADCGQRGYCSPSLGDCGDYGGTVGYYCHTPDDECTNDKECTAAGHLHCSYNKVAGSWMCSDAYCVG